MESKLSRAYQGIQLLIKIRNNTPGVKKTCTDIPPKMKLSKKVLLLDGHPIKHSILNTIYIKHTQMLYSRPIYICPSYISPNKA